MWLSQEWNLKTGLSKILLENDNPTVLRRECKKSYTLKAVVFNAHFLKLCLMVHNVLAKV